jgi:RNA polymerase sigma factor (sigma-70 family)
VAHAAAAHALLLRLTLRADVARELLHDVLVKAAARAAGVQNVGAYLRRAAINAALDWRRDRVQSRERAGNDAGDIHEVVDRNGRPPDQAVEDAELVARVLDAASKLPPLSREALVLRFVQGESYEAVGEALGRTAHQARGLCHAAVVEIRRRLNVREVAHARRERSRAR